MSGQATIAARLESWLAQHAINGKLISVHQSQLATDSTWKFVLRDKSGRPSGFVLCSPRSSPDVVRRGMERAQAARELLGPQLCQVILNPICADVVDGLSFAAFPYCLPLSSNRWIHAVQRRLLRPHLLRW